MEIILTLTRVMLDGLGPLDTGLGLGALRLIRFFSPVSEPACVGFCKLLGREGFLAGAGTEVRLAARAGAGGSGSGSGSQRVRAPGLANRPWFGSHTKYEMPPTEPSFLPSGSLSSTPTQIPSGLNSVEPMNRTSPCRPSLSWTICPTLRLDIVGGEISRVSMAISPRN